jgi:hypothetical protein
MLNMIFINFYSAQEIVIDWHTGIGFFIAGKLEEF